jgi:hypothetical protein
MTEFTDYQNLELPEPFNVNERDEWGRILNDALDTIDDKLILSGPLTARPPAQTQGRLFLDNGSGTLYRDNGSSWQRFGSQTDIQESQSTVSVNPNTINFNSGFTVTNPSFRTAKVEVDAENFVDKSGDSMEGTLDLNSNDLVDGAQAIWDASIGEIPDSAFGTIENATLANDSVTLNANDGLKSGGEVSLGGTVGFSIEPSDFAGSFLQEDGADNLAVLIGRGLEDDGSGNIRIDEDTAYNFQNEIDFVSGLQTDGDITDGSQVIWDSSSGYINQSELQNDSLTLNANDGLVGGGTVSLGGSIGLDINPSDFAGQYLSDDGSDNLTVDDVFLFNSGDDITGNLNFSNSDSIQDSGSDAIQFDGSAGIVLPNGGIRYEGGPARWTPGNRPVLEYTPDSGGTTENALFEFRTSGTNNREAYFGWDDSDTGIVFINQSTGSELYVSNNIQFSSGNLVDGNGLTVYNQANNSVPQDRLENDSITINANDGLKSGGNVILGGSVGLDIEPADFAGEGVEDDGSDNLRTDESYTHTWTTDQTFNGGITMGSSINASNNQITNLPEPTADDHAARKGYVDGVAQGLDLKDSCVAANTSNINLSSSTSPNPVDGHTVTDGERVLLKEQTDASENGIYVANTATDPTTWTRAPDADQDTEITDGTFTFVENGNQNGNTSYIVTSSDPITIGSTNIEWSQFSSAGDFSGGDGITRSGNTFAVNVSDFSGSFLSDDGSNNLTVDIGRGLENDTSGNVRVDEDTDFTFSQAVDFLSGFDTSGDITDGSQVIWDSSAGYISQSELQNDSITVNTNDGLVGGGSVALGGSIGVAIEASDFAGGFLTDDGNNNLDVTIGRGLEDDGSGDIRVDEDTNFTFTSKIDLSGGANLNGSDIDNVSGIEMDGDIEGTGFDFSLTEVSSVVGPTNGDTSLELRTQGDGSHDITLRDGFNGQDLLVANEGGDISVPSGSIDLNDNQINNIQGRGDKSGVITFNGVGSSIFADTGNIIGSTGDFESLGRIIASGGDIESGNTNSALEIDEQASIGDTGKAQLSRDARPQGYAMIQDVTNDQSAMVYLGGAANTVEILHDSGAGNEFTTVEDNNGTTNIYYDSGNNRYEINNETGGSATYSFQIMKA